MDGVEAPCYSGAAGEGALASPDSATQLTVVSPPLAKGGLYSVYLRSITGAFLKELPNALRVENRAFSSRTLSLRRMFPPSLAVGPSLFSHVDELARIDAGPTGLVASPSGGSTASGQLTVAHTMIAAVAATSDVSAIADRFQVLGDAPAAAASTAAADLSLELVLEAAPASVSAVAPALSVDRPIEAAPASVSAVAPALTAYRGLDAAPASVSAVAPDLSIDASVTAAAVSASTAVADMGVILGFQPAAPPGTPFAYYQAQDEAVGALATFTNQGSDATGDLGTNPGTTLDPSVIAAGAGSPVPGAQYVSFRKAGAGDALAGGLTTTRAAGTVFAAVVKWVGGPGSIEVLFDSNNTNNRHEVWRDSTLGRWRMQSGTILDGGSASEGDKWVRIVGRTGASGLLSVERATRISGNAGAETLPGITVGAAFNGGAPGDFDLACLAMWDDGTTVDEAREWLESEYPFEAVIPGNPSHHWSPRDYAAGAVATITDKVGSLDLTGTNMAVVLDAEGGQKAFDLDGTAYALTTAATGWSDDLMIATMIRPDTEDVTRNF
ncbi:MAG TPA: hypothetical protein VM285_04030, partial [Polyangia bacterium]|nr:hypothetical protein [Polyangia bacterium]